MSSWGWGFFLEKFAEQFQGRIERLRNESERLKNEREILMSKTYSASGSRRVDVIDDRLREITKILTNAAK